MLGDVTAADDPHLLSPDLLPTPFSADEIRDGCPPGRTCRTLVELADGTAHVRVSRFGEHTEDGCLYERWVESVDGVIDGEPAVSPVPWLALQRHAGFTAAVSTVAPERISTPLGELDCLRYDVRDGEDVTTFWFAHSLPGMPVKVVEVVAGQAVETATMVSNDSGG
jgi:hypothetical protein